MTHIIRVKYQLIAMLMASLTFLLSNNALALSYYLPTGGDTVMGQVQQARAQPGENLWQIGRRYDIGYREIRWANPHLSPTQVLNPWTKVTIPSRFVLPSTPRKGIVINLAELRLYYYVPNSNQVITMPVGIGRDGGFDTPTGVTRVIQKKVNPSWRPTANVREDAASKGYILPEVWPPGADNPLGQFAMRLGWHTYLIHGTNRPDGVGRRSSAGCIRMFPEDIENLFHQVAIGTPVQIVNQAFKVGKEGNELFLEVHKPIKRNGKSFSLNRIGIVKAVQKLANNRSTYIQWRNALRASQAKSGIPIMIGKITHRYASQ